MPTETAVAESIADWGHDTATAPLPEDCPQPTLHRVLLRPRPPRDFKTLAGGHKLFIPDKAKEAEEYGTCVHDLVAIGPGAFRDRDTGKPWFGEENHPKPGQYVLTARYGGHKIEYRGVKFILMNDDDLLAVVADIDAVKGYV